MSIDTVYQPMQRLKNLTVEQMKVDVIKQLEYELDNYNSKDVLDSGYGEITKKDERAYKYFVFRFKGAKINILKYSINIKDLNIANLYRKHVLDMQWSGRWRGFKYNDIFEYHRENDDDVEEGYEYTKFANAKFTESDDLYFNPGISWSELDAGVILLTSVEEATEFVRGRHVCKIGGGHEECVGLVLNSFIKYFKMYCKNNPRAIITFM
jgi:hypothetical protein